LVGAWSKILVLWRNLPLTAGIQKSFFFCFKLKSFQNKTTLVMLLLFLLAPSFKVAWRLEFGNQRPRHTDRIEKSLTTYTNFAHSKWYSCCVYLWKVFEHFWPLSMKVQIMAKIYTLFTIHNDFNELQTVALSICMN